MGDPVHTGRSPLARHIVLSFALFLCASLLTGAGAVSKQRTAPSRMGQVVDWSSRHILYPQGASLRALAMSQRDPRAYWNYLRITQAMKAARTGADDTAGLGAEDGMQTEAGRRPVDPMPNRFLKGPKKQLPTEEDWAVPLGTAGTATNMFPAKFSFNVDAAPSCANDFVVFAINIAPSATQANIAAYNNLYSGTIGGVMGICGGGTATATWAYQVSTVAVPTSPLISLDGTKVAFVDGANPAVFHVLTPTAGEGTPAAPATPTGAEIVNLPLTSGTDTNSSPFMDYYADIAYVGTDTGLIYQITGVFKGTPTLSGAPWPLTAGSGMLTGPVYDFNTGNIIVGSSDGNIYGFTPAGASLTGSPLLVGDGTAFGGFTDPPVLDEVNLYLYAATGGNSGGTGAELVQTGTGNFSTVQTAIIGTADAANIHSGAFNDAYFTAPTDMTGTPSEWFYYVCGNTTDGVGTPVLYRVGFNGSHVMNGMVDGTQVSLSGNPNEECSPLTEFQNGVDRLFLSMTQLSVVEAFNISTGTAPFTSGGPVTEPGGTSGIVVDNVSSANQASSIYFSTLSTSPRCRVGGVNRFCAVKLTQGALR